MRRPAHTVSPWLPSGRADGVAAATVVATVIVGWIGSRTPGESRADPVPVASEATPNAPAPRSPPAVQHDHDQDGQNILYGGEAPPYPNPFLGSLRAGHIFTGQYLPATEPFVLTTSRFTSATQDYGEVDLILLPPAR
jgi:hypothetical protein